MGSIRLSMLLMLTVIMCLAEYTNSLEDFNYTKIVNDQNYKQIMTKNGDPIFVKKSLILKLEKEAEIWHWTPWVPTRTRVQNNVLEEIECLSGNSIDSFPDGIFSDDQLRKGAFLLYVLFGIYSFTLLAIVCNDYFIPCVEFICEDLKIPTNVAAATFMAVATSCPEFFVNVISTFITESDMGIGTIVGSALFNALGVAAIGSISAIHAIKIDRRPVTRDVIIYMFNVAVLVAIVWDGSVMWYEALVLGILYILYFIIMFNSSKVFALYDKLAGCCKKETNELKAAENGRDDEVESKGVDNQAFDGADVNNEISNAVVVNFQTNVKDIEETEVKEDLSYVNIFIFPKERSIGYKIWWLYTLPLRFILGITIPSPVLCRKIYPLAFFMCVIWIGVNSYVVTWSMTVIGHTFFIPDSIMGMTFLAFGGCLPEACSIFIMSRRGEGGMGVSNALGANSLAILFALGLPWLIQSIVLLIQGSDSVVHINSSGIEFVVGSLLVAVVCLWIALYFAKFTLKKKLGLVLVFLYLIFITFAILVEIGIILDLSLPFC